MSSTHQKTLNYLDEIPEKLYRHLITHRYRCSGWDNELANGSQHHLQQRCTSVLKMRAFLVSAQALELVDFLPWLDANLAQIIYHQVLDSKLLKITRKHPEAADEVLIEILTWLNDVYHARQMRNEKSTAPLEPTLCLSLFYNRPMNAQCPPGSDSISQSAKRLVLERKLGWDLSRGVSSQVDVKPLLEAHELIKSSRQLQRIVQLLGRKQAQNAEQLNQTGLNQLPCAGAGYDKMLPDEHTINSVTGLCSGDDLCRMLPSELALLGHRKLKMLWHARRAERQLLNYHFRGVLSTHLPEFAEKSLALNEKARASVALSGPIILCVDTSASMQGKAQRIAKAIVLECVRVAHIEQRMCYLYCFSGENQIAEFELNMDSGWQAVIDFLRHSFNGGTDISSVLRRISKKLQHNDWASADMLLVSDGRFQITQQVLDNYSALHTDVRILGAQVSSWSTDKFAALCHQTFRLNNAL
ncbi:hypothetical protein MNBD_GAMMA10-623 [hydrothermal vent metagenome]|uniref:VWFA domain-containing protein n=1 Tax=hydrothermal vent metagenome TaxID=652676 RepID=A0A3B0Y6H8_9ZZZZ